MSNLVPLPTLLVIQPASVMKTNRTLFLLLLILASTTSCALNGSGRITSEHRRLKNIRGIDLRCGANVYLVQGPDQDVRIEGDDNLLGQIVTEVVNEQLIIRQSSSIHPSKPMDIYVTVPSLCLVELSGSGSIMMRNVFTCSYMNIRLGGSGNIYANVDAVSLRATICGTGNLRLSGSAAETDLRISGSGTLNAQGMICYSGNVSITGTGNSLVDVNNDLDVRIIGSGNVYYVTEPARLNKWISGTGVVSRI